MTELESMTAMEKLEQQLKMMQELLRLNGETQAMSISGQMALNAAIPQVLRRMRYFQTYIDLKKAS